HKASVWHANGINNLKQSYKPGSHQGSKHPRHRGYAAKRANAAKGNFSDNAFFAGALMFSRDVGSWLVGFGA
ncbi:MAG: hypothetical protein ONB49_20665, partial [candidate division KSB1 bacterium]|nr:hypothetical protein [candidate division KSB1 bacterium]